MSTPPNVLALILSSEEDRAARAYISAFIKRPHILLPRGTEGELLKKATEDVLGEAPDGFVLEAEDVDRGILKIHPANDPSAHKRMFVRLVVFADKEPAEA